MLSEVAKTAVSVKFDLILVNVDLKFSYCSFQKSMQVDFIRLITECLQIA